MRSVAVIYNPRSGGLISRSSDSIAEELDGLFRRNGMQPTIRMFDADTVADDVRALAAHRPEALFVVGGDGTVRSVATHLTGGSIPLGVLPAGTMNMLARDLGIPEDRQAALDALLPSPVRMIDIATIHGHPFLCSSALAVMPHLGRIREHARGAFGWSLVRLWIRGVRVLRSYPRTQLRVTVDGREHVVRTRALVISNNPLSHRPSPALSFAGRDRLDTGRLAVYVLSDRTSWDLVRIAAKLLNGSWQSDERMRTYHGREVWIAAPQKRVANVMSDGELNQLAMPLRYEIQPSALRVLAPRGDP